MTPEPPEPLPVCDLCGHPDHLIAYPAGDGNVYRCDDTTACQRRQAEIMRR